MRKVYMMMIKIEMAMKWPNNSSKKHLKNVSKFGVCTIPFNDMVFIVRRGKLIYES